MIDQRWLIAATQDVEIAYQSAGADDGLPIILLHGFPYDHLSYEAVRRLVAGPAVRVIVPALRGFGQTRLRPGVMRSGQQAALSADVLALMDALRIERAILAGFDWGGRAACVTAALQPERVLGLVTVDGYNIQDIAHGEDPAPAAWEKAKWYQHYFQTPAGVAGLTQNREDICQLLWRDWSPTWPDAAAAFARSAPSLHNPDFVDVVIHSYRHRRDAAPGDPQFEAAERALALQPVITVPTIALYPTDDGIPGSDPEEDVSYFTGFFETRTLSGVGHNPPQEDPLRFAEALRAVAAMVHGAGTIDGWEAPARP